MRRRPAATRGQAAVELLAAIPLVLGAALLAWQLLAVLAAGMRAQDGLLAEALRAGGPSGRVVAVRARAPVRVLLPGLGGLRVEARGAVRTP